MAAAFSLGVSSVEPERGLKLEVGLNPRPVLCVVFFGVFAVTPCLVLEMSTSNPSQFQLGNVLVLLHLIFPLSAQSLMKRYCLFRETSLRLGNVGTAQGNNNFMIF